MKVNKVIVLAAGQGYQLDGFNKLLIRDPSTGLTIIENYLNVFKGKELVVVVGFRAINIMSQFPTLKYIYNQDWAVTNNSYSLALALDENPCYVVSGDLIFSKQLIEDLDMCEHDVAVTQPRNNRTLSALNVNSSNFGVVQELYQGKLKNPHDPESIGIFKISSPQILRQWSSNCRKHKNLFVGQNLPLDNEDCVVHLFDAGRYKITEINTPQDYIRLIDQECRFAS